MPRLLKRSAFLLCFLFGLFFAEPNSHADTITTFDVFGQAINQSGGSLGSCPSDDVCSVSGTISVDVTSGTAKAIEVTFPGLAAFDTLTLSVPVQPAAFLWTVEAGNSTFDQVMILEFGTQTPGSLVGYAGGSIFGCCVSGELIRFYSISPSCCITALTRTPEPSSVALALVGIAVMLIMRGAISRSGKRLRTDAQLAPTSTSSMGGSDSI